MEVEGPPAPETPWPWILASWVVALGTFTALCAFLGGPSRVDLSQTLYPALAVAHGHFSCLYPPVSPQVFNTAVDPATYLSHRYFSIAEGTTVYVSPGMPLLLGLGAALLHLGRHTPFPALAHCSQAIPQMDRWLFASGAARSLTNIAYAAWIPLAAGATAVARAAIGRRSPAMAIVPLVLAVTPPVLRCLVIVFHAEDLVAIGLTFVAVAVALRGRWGRAGVALAVGALFQPFVVLAGAVMVVLAPAHSRRRIVVAGAATYGALLVPLVALSGWRVVTAAVFGSSRVTPGAGRVETAGGTVVAELHLKGVALFVVARLLPVVAAVAAAAVARRRRGDGVLSPEVMIALVGVAYLARVLFDENFIGYYLAPVAVALVVLEAVRGRVRSDVVVWIGLVSVMGTAVPDNFDARFPSWGAQDYRVLYLVALAAFAVTTAVRISRRSAWVFPLAALLLVAYTYGFAFGPLSGPIPRWLLQVLEVPSGLWLVTAPLREQRATRVPARSVTAGT